MSPEITIDDKLIADVPDKNGLWDTRDGGKVLVNVDGIDPMRNGEQTINVQRLGEGGKWIGMPMRKIGFTQDGEGTAKIKKGGDGLEPVIKAKLHEPIRIAEQQRVWQAEPIRAYGVLNETSRKKEITKTRPNPVWVKGNR